MTIGPKTGACQDLRSQGGGMTIGSKTWACQDLRSQDERYDNRS
jgi:hypothetical protein